MLIGIHLLIALHIAHWLIAGTTITPVEPSEAMAFSKISVVNAGLIFFAAMILLTAVFGRFFCGWACHLVALQDLARWLLMKVGIQPKPLRSRLLKWVPYLAFFYMFLWPVVYRLWIGDSFAVRGAELTTPHFWETFPGWIVGGLTFLSCGFVIVYFLGAKGFCTYACPYGAIFSIAERVSPLRIRVTDACQGCAHCTAVCSSNVRVHEEVRDYGMVVDSGCMKCLDCVSVCPNDALYYGRGPIPLFTKPRREPSTALKRAWLGWEEVVLAVAFAAAFYTFRGLYGLVPFLMALGIAGILAYLVLTLVHLAVRADLHRYGWTLKSQGTLRRAGKVFAGAMVLVLGFWGVTAWARVQAVRVDAVAAHARLAAEEAKRRGDLSGAAAALERWVAVEPKHLAPYLELGLIAAQRGDLEGAETWFTRGLGVGESADLVYNAALVKALQGDAVAAIRGFERALVLNPLHRAARENLAGVLASVERFEESAVQFRKALEQAPEDVETRFLLARVLAAQGKHEEALTEIDQVLEKDPRNLQAMELRADISRETAP